MQASARLIGQTLGASLVALVFVRMPEHGTVTSLYVGVGFALVAAGVSSLRLFDRTGQIAKS